MLGTGHLIWQGWRTVKLKILSEMGVTIWRLKILSEKGNHNLNIVFIWSLVMDVEEISSATSIQHNVFLLHGNLEKLWLNFFACGVLYINIRFYVIDAYHTITLTIFVLISGLAMVQWPPTVCFPLHKFALLSRFPLF